MDIDSNVTEVPSERLYKVLNRESPEVSKLEQSKREPLTTKKAVEFLLSGTLKRKVCRYCLNIAHPLSELDQILRIAGKHAMYEITIRDIVASFHPFKVVDDENFPDKICEKCLNRSLKSYLFAQQCEQSERALRNCFQDMFEKLEKLDPLEQFKRRGRQKTKVNHNILYTEHCNVIDYAEPIRHMINAGSISYTKEPTMSNLECKKCWQVLPNVESLAYHEKMHPKSMWYSCRLCGQSMPQLYLFRRHLRSHLKQTKGVIEVNENRFECKQCGTFSENYMDHLQHLEKHKFKKVLECVVERKMDKLCAVCLEEGSLTDLDKVICLHGGYPELTGDRPLYSILGSSVPEKQSTSINSYKYQELFVPRHAEIMTITKRIKTIDQNDFGNLKWVFKLSYPVVVATGKIIHNTDFHFFVFSKPLINNDDENSHLLHDKNDITEITELSAKKYLNEENNYIVPSKHDLIIGTDDFEVPKSNIMEEYETEQNLMCKRDKQVMGNHDSPSKTENKINVTQKLKSNNICNSCWLFRTVGKCYNCNADLTEYSNEDFVKNLNGDNAENFVSVNADDNMGTQKKNCKSCWLYKSVGKCLHCEADLKECKNGDFLNNCLKDKTESSDSENEEYNTVKIANTSKGYADKIDDKLNKIIITQPLENEESNKAGNKRKIDMDDSDIEILLPKRPHSEEIKTTTKVSKWDCFICLTTNNSNRELCMCCENSNIKQETSKVNLEVKKDWLFDDFQKTPAIEKDYPKIAQTESYFTTNHNHSPKENIEKKLFDVKNFTNNEIKVTKTEVSDEMKMDVNVTENTEETNVFLEEYKKISETVTRVFDDVNHDDSMEVEEMNFDNNTFAMSHSHDILKSTSTSFQVLPEFDTGSSIGGEMPMFQFHIGSFNAKEKDRKPRRLRRMPPSLHK